MNFSQNSVVPYLFFCLLILTYATIFGVFYAVISPNYNTDYPEYQHCD